MKLCYPYIPEQSADQSPRTQHFSSLDTEDVALTSKQDYGQVNASQIDPVPVAAPANPADFDEAKGNKQLSMELLKQLVKKVGFFQFNLGAVYFLEYMCLTSFADRFSVKMNEAYPEHKHEWVYKNGYVIFTFCYQIGVFMSRSSLSLIKVPRVEIMTILQLINFMFFLMNTIFLFLPNFYVGFVFMVWVGLMGGGSYVNVMYQILESPNLAKSEKELALTLTTVCNDIGILSASLMSLLLANTAFSSK